MRRLQKGSFTIEAAVVIPMLLFVIGGMILLFFYCHDKNVMAGAAGEAVSVEAGRAGSEDFASLTENKLLWFRDAKIEIEERSGYIVATVSASRLMTQISVEEKMKDIETETFIRNVRKINE